MSAIESKGDFLMYRETMTELEILVDLRGIYISDFSEKSAVEEGIIYMLELLTEYDVNTTELNAIEELERLAEMRVNFAQQHRQVPDWTAVLASRDTFDKLINSKINFVKNGSFSRLISKGGLEPMAALQRLVVVKRKINSHHIDGLMEELLESKIREVVWRPRVKRSTISATDACTEATTVSIQASQKQENPKCDLSNEREGSKATKKFVLDTLSWLQDQDNVLATDDDSSTIDGGELTPTSTIISELPDFTDG